MKVYQGFFEYFFGAKSGYGTIKTKYGNVFSNKDACIKNIKDLMLGYEIKEFTILEYDLDSFSNPIVVSIRESIV